MLRELPDYLKPVWCFSYYTEVRAGELKKLLWEWLDWNEWVIRVPGHHRGERITKNGETHVIPVYLEMREFVKMMYGARNPACPYLFQRDCKRIKSFRSAFENARARVRLGRLLPDALRAKIGELNQTQLRALDAASDAEVLQLFERALRDQLTAEQIDAAIQDRASKPLNLLFHDQRRTAVTNMIREGVPEKQALALSGHLDPSMLRRYSIVKEQDVKSVAQRMTERFLRQRKAERAPEPEQLWRESWHEGSSEEPEAIRRNAAKLKQ